MNASYARLLTGIRAMALDGKRTPCSTGDRSDWLSDSPDARKRAEAGCRPCPLLCECDAAAVEVGPRFGVWGGRDRTDGRLR
jgi:hypothetical protein